MDSSIWREEIWREEIGNRNGLLDLAGRNCRELERQMKIY
jgi:hypothetical protein